MPNVFQHLADMKLLVASVYQASSLPAFSDSMFQRSLAQAYAQIQAKMRLGDTRISSNLVSGTDTYTIPETDSNGFRSPRFGRQLRVYCHPMTGDAAPIELEWHDQAWMMARGYNLASTTQSTGFPRFWMEADEAPLGRIKIRPVPNFSRANGLVFCFTAAPNQIIAPYYQTAITATFTYGSTAVTFSADPSPYVVAGYEIGVPPLVQIDGTPQYDAVPTAWVKIASVSGVNAVLNEGWPGLTGAGQTFIVSVVMNLDQMLPGGLETLPSTLATKIMMRTIDPEKAAGISESADEMMGRLNIDQSAMDLGQFRKSWLTAPGALSPGYGGGWRTGYYGGGWYW